MDIVLRSDFAGAAAALCDNVDDASGGNGTSASSDAVDASFKRFLRRCGGSSAGGTWPAMFADDEDNASDAPSFGPSIGAALLGASFSPSLDLRKALAQKNVLSAFSSLATALWNRRVVRLSGCALASLLAHRVHIVPPSIDRSRAAVGGRRSMRVGWLLLFMLCR